MGFTEEELRAWVLDGGTRFVPPQNKHYEDNPDHPIERVIRRVVMALRGAFSGSAAIFAQGHFFQVAAHCISITDQVC